MGNTPLILHLRNVDLLRGGDSRFALRIKRLDAARGECLALVGPSGCGKSTALDILAGILRPTVCENFLFSPGARALRTTRLEEESRPESASAMTALSAAPAPEQTPPSDARSPQDAPHGTHSGNIPPAAVQPYPSAPGSPSGSESPAEAETPRAPSASVQPEPVPADIATLWKCGNTDKLAALRLAHIGYILQTGGLLPFLTAGEQIQLGCRLLHDRQGRQRAAGLAAALGIEALLRHYPATLSVGERQRVAIAKALSTAPDLVLADEPTAALDPNNAHVVMNLFARTARRLGCTVIMVTHAPELARQAGFTLVPLHISGSGKDCGTESTIDYAPAAASRHRETRS